MSEQTGPNDPRFAYWRTRRRRHLFFMIGRYLVLMAVLALIAWATGGGRWLAGVALVAGLFLVLRLVFFFYAGRHFEKRLAQRDAGRRRFPRF